MSLRDECDCDCHPTTAATRRASSSAGNGICPDCCAKYKPEGDGDWRCLLGGLPAGRWSGRILDLSDAALLALADAITRERARRGGP